jgi:chromodomain-helicase-DNA-binding protein 7
MGLGKTAQTIAFLEHINRVHGLHGPFLIVCPLSTLQQWKRETETWTHMPICVYHDSAEGRAMIRDLEWFHDASTTPKFTVIVTSNHSHFYTHTHSHTHTC